MILRDSFLDIESLLLALLHGNTLYFSLSLTRKIKKIIVTFVGSCQAQGIRAVSKQIYLVTLRPTQLTQASFLQKNQMLQNGFLIFLTLR